MPGMNEQNSVQRPLVDELVQLGWSYVPGKDLDREHEQVFVEPEVAAALARLNRQAALRHLAEPRHAGTRRLP